MKKFTRCSSPTFFHKKRNAIALPMSLIVLLVAGMLVGVSMLIVENMSTVIAMKSDDELRLNAALEGLEIGKKWITRSIMVDGHIPRSVKHTTFVTSSDMSGAYTTSPHFKFLLARDINGIEGFVTGNLEGVTYESAIYDTVYRFHEGAVLFTKDMPMHNEYGGGPPPGGSGVQDQSYPDSNRGGGPSGFDDIANEYGYYIIRSKAVLNDIEKVIEQGVKMRK